MFVQMVPENLTQKQKENQKNIGSDITERLTEELDWHTRVITDNKTWIFHYDLDRKRQSNSMSKYENSANKQVKSGRSFFFRVSRVYYHD